MSSLKLIVSNPRYFSVAWVFCSLNIMIGTWVLYIPSVKSQLNLSDSEIGIALFCMSLGLISILPLVPMITKKIGLGKTTTIGISLFALSFTLPVMASSFLLLCISLFMVGIFSGATDVAMNALVSEMEKRDKVFIMSSSHGFFSVGGAIGAILGSFLLLRIGNPFYHMALMALIVIVVNIILTKNYVAVSETFEEKEKKKFAIIALKPLFFIAFFAFVIMSCEGAMIDWSALYMLEIVQISNTEFAGMGFILFSITMTIGRFFGDGITKKFGSMKTLIWGVFVACAGYILILTQEFLITITGFGVVGLGLSVVIPEIFRIAGNSNKVNASTAISFVSGIGFLGFLLGPVVLGFISDKFNLAISFLFLFLLILITNIVFLLIKKSGKSI